MLKKILILVIASLGMSPVALAVKGQEAKRAKAEASKASKKLNTLKNNVQRAQAAVDAAVTTWKSDIHNANLQAKVRTAQARLTAAQEALRAAQPTLDAQQAKENARKAKVASVQQEAKKREEAVQKIKELQREVQNPQVIEQPQIEGVLEDSNELKDTNPTDTKNGSTKKIVENVLLFGGLVTSAGLLRSEVYAANKEAKTFHKRLSFAYAKTVAQLCKEQLKAKKKKCIALGVALGSALTGAGIKLFVK